MPKKRLSCDLCKSKELKKIFNSVSDYETSIEINTNILICERCNLIQQSKIFTIDEIEKFYLEDYHVRNYDKPSLISSISSYLRSRYYNRFISLLEKRIKNKDIKILDYGSGDGFLCNELKKRGFKNIYTCDFYEPNFKGINHIHPDNIHNFKKFFDVMFMINSIEHLISFNNDFQSLDSAMKDSSTLIIETPNFGSLDLLLFKKYWGGLHQPRHTFLWTKKSLVEHLALWNYNSKFFKSNLSSHWAISIQNLLSHKYKFFRKLLLNGRMPGYLILVLFFLPITIVQNFFDLDSVINVLAVRNKR